MRGGWYVGAGFVVSRVTADTGRSIDCISLLSCVLAGTGYAMCQGVWRLNAHWKESPICHALDSRVIENYQRADLVQATEVQLKCSSLVYNL